MSGLHVICYHRVLPVVSSDIRSVDCYHAERSMLHSLDDFRRQLDAIQSSCDVLDAAQFAERRRSPSPGRPAVLLTFDDGYADFSGVVLPELLGRGLPSALFPTKAPVVDGFIPPADKVYAILAAAHHGAPSHDRVSWISGKAKKALLRASPAEQEAMIRALAAELGVDTPAHAPPHMTEAQVRSLPACVHVGAHGLFHHEFASLAPAQLRAELAEILAWVRRIRPGQTAGLWLAYPNGKADRPESPGAITSAVGESGVNLAFVARREAASATGGSDLLVPRLFSQNGVAWLDPIFR